MRRNLRGPSSLGFAVSLMLAPCCSMPSRLFEKPRLVGLEAAQQTNVVHIPKFLSSEEIDELHTTAAGVATRGEGEQDIHRRQGCAEGSWLTVFLNQRLAEQLPHIHSRLVGTAHEADAANWGLLDDRRHDLAFRVAEYHTVRPGGGIPMDKHHDFGSLLTLDLMLSTPGVDFEGGTFCTPEPDGTLTQHTFERGDLIIFHSHKYHMVQPVASGTRRVLVCELWEGLERRCPRRCNTPWGPCVCQFAPPPALYDLASIDNSNFSSIKPCLRLMAKSDDDLRKLRAELEADPARAGELQQVCTHALWKAKSALDKECATARG